MADWQPPASDKPVGSAAPAWTPPATDKPWTPPATDKVAGSAALAATPKPPVDLPSTPIASQPTMPAVVTGAASAGQGVSSRNSPGAETSAGPSLPERIAADVMKSGGEWLSDMNARSATGWAEMTDPAVAEQARKQHTITGDIAAGLMPIQGLFDYVTSPITGTADYAIGRPAAAAADALSRATGQGGIDTEEARRKAGDVAGAVLPFVAPKGIKAANLAERFPEGPETRSTELLKTPDIEKSAAADAAAKAQAQQRTSETLSAARGATTPVTDFTPADLGPNLTGKVNLRRFRSGQAATDKFTREDLEAAGVSAEDIEKLRAKKLGTLASSDGLAPAVTTEDPAVNSPLIRQGKSPENNSWTAGPVADEGPLSRAPALTTPREFEDQLHQLTTMREADAVDAVKRTRALPKELSPALLEKMYASEEVRGPKLTPEEQALYDEHIKPLREEDGALRTELRELSGKHMPDVSTEELEQGDFLTPRYVKDRTRSFGQMLEQWKQGIETRFKGGAGGGLRKTVDTEKSRRYWMIEDPATGEQRVAWIAPDRNVFLFDGKKISDPVGKLASQGGPKLGSKIRIGDGTAVLEHANTNEIEAATQTQYIKNLFANRLDTVLKLRAAVRNFKFLDQMKTSPDWEKVALEKKTVAQAPRDPGGRYWRTPKAPQFQGYYMEPKVADAIDDLIGSGHDAEGLAAAADKIGRVANIPMFVNPLFHLRNVWSHYWTSKGLVGGALGLPSEYGRLMRAAKEVMTLGPEYIRSLNAGASLPYARWITKDLHEQLVKKLGETMAEDPKTWAKIAGEAGMAPARLIKAVYNFGQVGLWAGSDIMTLARQMELREKGIPIERAIKQTEEHMPNYRVPGQVMGKRWAAQVFNTPLVGRFGRYQYGRLASYMRMARDIAATGSTVEERAHALDQLAALGVRLFIFGAAFDKAWQAVTGNPNAKLQRAGAESVPQAALDLVNGDKDIGGFMASLYSPGVGLQAASDLYNNRYGWSGQKILHENDLREGRLGQAAKDVGEFGLNTFGGPVAAGLRQSPAQFGLSQLGVRAPTQEQIDKRAKYRARDAKADARRALRDTGE